MFSSIRLQFMLIEAKNKDIFFRNLDVCENKFIHTIMSIGISNF